MFGYFKRRRRRKLIESSLTEHERAVVERYVPYVRYLPADKRYELEGLIRVFLWEKTFEGCGGTEVTDDMRLAIAAQACLLLVGRGTDVYPLLSSVLVYPSAYVASEPAVDSDGIVDETPEERIGESWIHGSVVLSWEDVERGGALDGINVVFHEFAHQLDHESGRDDGTPVLPNGEMRRRWFDVMTRAYEELVRAVEAGESTLFDEYGAESPVEFFAVVTECFFELPGEMRVRHPDLYALLADFYRQDPAVWVPALPRLRRRVRRHPRRRV
jgi:Mlc titration factor MtfA (ptsG expression regulator)